MFSSSLHFTLSSILIYSGQAKYTQPSCSFHEHNHLPVEYSES